jgi:hypothetical protein
LGLLASGMEDMRRQGKGREIGRSARTNRIRKGRKYLNKLILIILIILKALKACLEWCDLMHIHDLLPTSVSSLTDTLWELRLYGKLLCLDMPDHVANFEF